VRGLLLTSLAMDSLALGAMFDRPAMRRVYEGGYDPPRPPRDHDAHVRDWRHELKRQAGVAERAAIIAAQRERDRPMIEAAEARRAARNAKRLRSAQNSTGAP
jgi:hypothetical protein